MQREVRNSEFAYILSKNPLQLSFLALLNSISRNMFVSTKKVIATPKHDAEA
jgi:hypothetical protein